MGRDFQKKWGPIGHIVIFGGLSGNTLLNDTWELNP
jgi:hypothetical protein